MSPFVAYHATACRHRESIREHGLLAGSPQHNRPFGVYVFRGDSGHPTYTRSYVCRWAWQKPLDLWQVSYIGPLAEDEYVENSWVFLDSVPVDHITLITDNTGNLCKL